MARSTSLSQVNFTDLAFSQLCSSVSTGLDIYNYFACLRNCSTLGQDPLSNLSDNGPAPYESWWSQGPPSEWIDFWRSALATALQPNISQILSDQAIAEWANRSECFDFFGSTYNDVGIVVDPNNVNSLALDISAYGGCKSYNQSYDVWGGYIFFTGMVEECVLEKCCPYAPNAAQLSSNTIVFSNLKWTFNQMCAFRACDDANTGNPDLGGIGVSIYSDLQGHRTNFQL
jgi:hypothetical protein